jgi:hypothetical protein
VGVIVGGTGVHVGRGVGVRLGTGVKVGVHVGGKVGGGVKVGAPGVVCTGPPPCGVMMFIEYEGRNGLIGSSGSRKIAR